MDNAGPYANSGVASMPDFVSIIPAAKQQLHRPRNNTHRRLFLLAGLLILLQGCASTPPVSPSEEARTQAKAAFQANDYQRTLNIVIPMAQAGEAWAQYTLGYMYHYGLGITLDRQLAKQWIQRAAEQAYPPAQEALRRISLPPPKTEEEMVSPPKPTLPGVKENAVPAPPAPEEKKEQVPPSSQATPPTPAEAPISTALPPTEPAPSLGVPAENTGPITQPPAPAPQEMAPTPPAGESTPSVPPTSQQDQTPGTTPTTEPDNPPAVVPPSPPAASPPATAPSPSTQNQASPLTSSNHGIKSRDWISKQDPRHVTLQLISSVNEAAVISFIRNHDIEHEAAYYSTLRGGQLWYSVVYGDFPTRKTAQQALKKLPPSLRRDAPRIRSFKEIHAQLSAAP